MIITDYSNKI